MGPEVEILRWSIVQLAVAVASAEITPLSRLLIRLRRQQHGGALILGRAAG